MLGSRYTWNVAEALGRECRKCVVFKILTPVSQWSLEMILWNLVCFQMNQQWMMMLKEAILIAVTGAHQNLT